MFDWADVLDQLALHPDRRDRGMSRAGLLEALGLGFAEAQALSDTLGRLSRAGYVRKIGGDKVARWLVTTKGMKYQPDEDWTGERWGAFNGSQHPTDEAKPAVPREVRRVA